MKGKLKKMMSLVSRGKVLFTSSLTMVALEHSPLLPIQILSKFLNQVYRPIWGCCFSWCTQQKHSFQQCLGLLCWLKLKIFNYEKETGEELFFQAAALPHAQLLPPTARQLQHPIPIHPNKITQIVYIFLTSNFLISIS